MHLSEDEHAVGRLAAGGQDEPFRVGVRPRALRWDLVHGDGGIGQYGVEGCGELPAAVADQEFELVGAFTEVHEQILACCAVQSPSGLAVTPRMCTYRLPTSITKNTYRRLRVSAQFTWKKSQ